MVVPGREKLLDIVEVDETFVGGKTSGKRGRGAEGKTLVIIAVEIKEKSTGRVRLSVIPNVSSNSLDSFVSNNIEPESKVITDNWRGYSGIKQLGYLHEIESKTVIFEEQEVLPNVHSCLVKKMAFGYASKLL